MMLTKRQIEALKAYDEDGEAPDYADYSVRAGAGLAWINRERVISALRRKGLLNEDGITAEGRTALAQH